MINEIEKISRLIEQASTALAKATTAAEILDVYNQADVSYSAAKKAIHLIKQKAAHDTVVTACRKVMGDALVIETRAQCRLADEYDAAQERGEVATRGDGTAIRDHIPNKNKVATIKDIGLTSKKIHEARAVRDAEKAKPGGIRKAIEEKLASGKEPTRADVNRIVRPPKPRAERQPQAVERENKVAALKDAGLSPEEIAGEIGLGLRAVHQALEHVEIRREAEAEIDPSTLSMTAQEKLAAAMRQHQRKLDAAFEQRVLEECRRRMDEISLPHWRQQIEQAKQLYARRKALMSKETFNTIRRGLHPDSRNAISEKKLSEAFDAFMGLEKFLLDEKDSPTPFGDVPGSLAEWDRMRAKRSAKRASGSTAVRRR
jgi:hypothetical protein